MSAATTAAKRGINPGPVEFDHPHMIKARRMWAEAIARGTLLESDADLLVYLQVESIRDRLLADVVDPTAWDLEDLERLFAGDVDPDSISIPRIRVVTDLCMQLVGLAVDTSDIAPMIMIMAFIQWLLGASHLAMEGARLALRSRPDYLVAQQLELIIQHNIKPAWMTRA